MKKIVDSKVHYSTPVYKKRIYTQRTLILTVLYSHSSGRNWPFGVFVALLFLLSSAFIPLAPEEGAVDPGTMIMGHYQEGVRAGSIPFENGNFSISTMDEGEDFEHVWEIEPEKRFISYWNIAHSSSNESRRLVGQGFANSSAQGPYWPWFVETKVQPLIEKGFTRFHIHNPFGLHTGEIMSFDQYLDASVEVPLLVENFTQAWKPITDAGYEVVGYFGSPHNDPDQVALKGNMTAWWERAWQCLEPFLDTNMTIGLDNTAPRENTSESFLLAETLRNMGKRVIIEARAWNVNPAWFKYDWVTREDTYHDQNPGVPGNHPVVYTRFPVNERINGETIRLIFKPWWDANQSIFDGPLFDGHTVLCHPYISAITDNNNLDEVFSILTPNGTIPVNMNLSADGFEHDLDTYKITEDPKYGALTDQPHVAAKWQYRPQAHYSGYDNFTYTINDSARSAGPFKDKVIVRPPNFIDLNLELDKGNATFDKQTRKYTLPFTINNPGNLNATPTVDLMQWWEPAKTWQSPDWGCTIDLEENFIESRSTLCGEVSVTVPEEVLQGNFPFILIAGSNRTALEQQMNFTTAEIEDWFYDDNEAWFQLEVDIPNLLPLVQIEMIPEDPYVYELITFTANSEDPDGEIVTYHWDMGDGATSNKMVRNHTYIKETEFVVNLTVTDNRGGIASVQRVVNISNAPPKVVVDYQELVVEERELSLTGIGSDTINDEDTLLYSWDFGDGTVTEWANTTDTMHTYLLPGFYDATLTARDDDNATGSGIVKVEVYNLEPTAKLKINKSEAMVNESIFLDASETTDTPTDMLSLNYTWEPGDGTILYGINATHTYKRSDDYQIELTVRDNDGARNKVVRHFWVKPLPEPTPPVNTTPNNTIPDPDPEPEPEPKPDPDPEPDNTTAPDNNTKDPPSPSETEPETKSSTFLLGSIILAAILIVLASLILLMVFIWIKHKKEVERAYAREDKPLFEEVNEDEQKEPAPIEGHPSFPEEEREWDEGSEDQEDAAEEINENEGSEEDHMDEEFPEDLLDGLDDLEGLEDIGGHEEADLDMLADE